MARSIVGSLLTLCGMVFGVARVSNRGRVEVSSGASRFGWFIYREMLFESFSAFFSPCLFLYVCIGGGALWPSGTVIIKIVIYGHGTKD